MNDNIKKLRRMMDANPPKPKADPLFQEYLPPLVWAQKLREAGQPEEDIQTRAIYLHYDIG